ncbi:MAG: SLC13 family permease [Thermoanaerobaculum sp.]
MAWQGWVTLGVVATSLGALIITKLSADLVFLGGLAVLLMAGVLSPNEAFLGFADPGVVTIGLLYVVISGLTQTGALHLLAYKLFGAPRSDGQAARRLLPAAAMISSFLNNTPVVAMLIPVVRSWHQRWGVSASKLLLPLSYAVILGGTCTLVGTSTNLIVWGYLLERGTKLGLFDPLPVGLPTTALGLLYLLLMAPRLLAERATRSVTAGDVREYAVEMLLLEGSPLVGKTVEEAGLRHLQGVYLAEIQRQGKILPAVGPEEVLSAGDRLVFVGLVDSIMDLQRLPGLVPAPDQLFKLDTPRHERVVVEAVIGAGFPGLGKTIRDMRFRTLYDAVVLAVTRGGERIKAKVGDVVLEPGDCLLLEAGAGFLERFRHARDFYLISPVNAAPLTRNDRAVPALLVVGGMLLLAGSGLVSMLVAAMMAAAAMLVLGCTTPEAARQSVEWTVLVAVGAAIGLGEAMGKSGAAAYLASRLATVGGDDKFLALVTVYAAVALLTEVVTNNAAAVLMLPIAENVARLTGAPFLPYALAVMFGASASFMTPMGYQTNLMVQGPGGYRAGDYLRLGIPLKLVVGAMVIALIPWFWPLQ